MLYIQSFTDKKCILTVYKENKLRIIVYRKNLTDIWFKINYKLEFSTDKLFGINNEYT